MSTSTSQIYQDPELLNFIEDPIFGNMAENESEGAEPNDEEEKKDDGLQYGGSSGMLFGDPRNNSCLNESRRASSIENVIRPSFKRVN